MNYIIQQFTVTSDNNTGEINEASLFLSLSPSPDSPSVSGLVKMNPLAVLVLIYRVVFSLLNRFETKSNVA